MEFKKLLDTPLKFQLNNSKFSLNTKNKKVSLNHKLSKLFILFFLSFVLSIFQWGMTASFSDSIWANTALAQGNANGGGNGNGGGGGQINQLEQRITDLEVDNSAQQLQIDTNQTNIDSNTTTNATQQTAIDANTTDINTNTATNATQDTAIDANTTTNDAQQLQIDDLQNDTTQLKLDTADLESENATQQGQIDANTATNATQNAAINSNTATNATQQTAINSNTATNATQDAAISANTAINTTQDAAISANTATNATQDATISTNSASITTNQTDITNLQNDLAAIQSSDDSADGVEITFAREINFNTGSAFIPALDINGSNLHIAGATPSINLAGTPLTVLTQSTISGSQQQVVVQLPAPLTTGTYKLNLANSQGGSFFFTPIKDPSDFSITAVGNAQLRTDQKKFGTASGFFNGRTDYLSIPDHPDWHLGGGTGDFTIDFWIRRHSNQQHQYFFNQGANASIGNAAIDAQMNFSSVTTLRFNQVTFRMDAAFYPPLNQWVHIAYVRSGNTFYIFINGTIRSQKTQAVTIQNSTDDFRIGFEINNGLRAYMDEFRLSNIARWTSNFTPPNAAYSVDSNTQRLIHFDGPNSSNTFIDSAHN